MVTAMHGPNLGKSAGQHCTSSSIERAYSHTVLVEDGTMSDTPTDSVHNDLDAAGDEDSNTASALPYSFAPS